jgi:hypothetical protein
MNDREDRLKEVAGIAVALEEQTGCPSRLMIAQWALESEWGAKPAGHANYFGIKKAARHTQCCTVTTHEVSTGNPLSRSWNSLTTIRSRIPARTTRGSLPTVHRTMQRGSSISRDTISAR